MRLSRLGIPSILGRSLEQLVKQLNIVFSTLRDFLNRIVDSNNEFDEKLSCFNIYVRDRQVRTLTMQVENFTIDISKLKRLHIVFRLDETTNMLKIYVKRSDDIVKVGSIPLA